VGVGENKFLWTGGGGGGGGGGSQYKLPGPGCPVTDYILLYVFVFLDGIIICRLYKLTLSDHAQVTLRMRVSFQFSVNILSRYDLAGEAENIFSPGPEPAIGGPDDGSPTVVRIRVEKHCHINHLLSRHFHQCRVIN